MKSVLRYGTSLAIAALIAACSAAAPDDASSDVGNPSNPSNPSNPDPGTGAQDDAGSTTTSDAAAPPPSEHDAGAPGSHDSGAPAPDSGGGSQDSGTPPSPQPDASPPSPQPDASPPPPPSGDGTPTRQQCTGNFGSALTTTHGRIDGYLVSILGLGGSKQCNGDSSHVHLQIKMNNAIYDVAVNSDTLIAERDIPLPDGAWSEGWHPSDALDYAQLGLHTSDFQQPSSASALAQQIENELANVNHISVFATGYGPTGAHLVHRNGSGNDGAIVTEPLSGTAHAMMFIFTTSSQF